MKKYHFMRYYLVGFAYYIISFAGVADIFTPGNVNQLINDITTANTNGEDDEINLAGNIFTLSVVNNSTDGENGLPSILSDNGHSLLIRNGIIERSLASIDTYRIFHLQTEASLSLEDIELRNGVADDAALGSFGGAIFVSDGALIESINNSSFSNNSALDGGGAIFSNSAFIQTINNTTFSSNEATNSGGAINGDLTATTISNSTFSNNEADQGGAFFGNLDILINSTFSANSAESRGGAISGGVNSISNSTISGNSAVLEGGGIYASVIIDLTSNIVAANSAPDGPDIFTVGSITNESFNLIGDNSDSTITDGTPNANASYVGTAISPIDPMLGLLQDNGGPTETMALLPGSLALDHGANPFSLQFDQRGPGYLRTRELQTDIGAFEFQDCLDTDGDGICNDVDNCPLIPNEDQSDEDDDGVGDECDNCIDVPNPDQNDADADGNGDGCDICPDNDGDGICNEADNCRFEANPGQEDTDEDDIGNACDTCGGGSSEVDSDSDGVCDAADRCPNENDALDTDGDGLPDGCDNCPDDPNNNQLDKDQDGIGDACDDCTDQDEDGICDEDDNCPFDFNPSQDDGDHDDRGDACDKLIDLEIVRPEVPVALPPPPIPLPVAPLTHLDPLLGTSPIDIIEAPKSEFSILERNAESSNIDDSKPILSKKSHPINKKSPASGCSLISSPAQDANNLWFVALLSIAALRKMRIRQRTKIG